jgi:hypothetical protein
LLSAEHHTLKVFPVVVPRVENFNEGANIYKKEKSIPKPYKIEYKKHERR